MKSRVMIWGGITVTVLACIGLGIYFGFAGLSKATDLSGIIGMFVAVAGLGVSLWGVITAKSAEPVGGQTVTGSVVGGGVNQVSGVGHSVRIGGAPPPATAPPARPTATAPGAVTAGPGGQSVTDSEVTGPVNQIRDVGGDVDIDGSP